MSSTIKIKRSSVAGKIPLVADIITGELAINTKDKKLYSSNSTAVFEIGSRLTNLFVSGNTTVSGLIANGSLGTSGKVLKTNGTSVYWATDLSQIVVANTTPSAITGNTQSFTGNGSTSAFNINESISSADAIVTINGLVQKPTTHYSISGSTITFTTTPSTDDSIEVRRFVGQTSGGGGGGGDLDFGTFGSPSGFSLDLGSF